MLKSGLQWFLLVFCFATGLTSKAPSFIHPCSVNTEECITKAVQDAVPEFTKGIPSLDVGVLDPFPVTQLDVNLPGGLKISLKDGEIIGFKKCLIEKAVIRGTTFDMDSRCNITIKGKYQASGRILLFPINGDGDCKIKITNIKFHIKMHTVNKIAKDGKYHTFFKDYKVKHAWGDKVTFQLTNLFKGNPEISNTVLQFMNDNWRTVVDEFGGPLVDVATERVVENIKNFFANVPYEELSHVPVIVE